MNRTLEATREMKDSGIEWIGKIPQEWELAPLKAILKERKEKNLPIKTTNILSLTIDKGVIPYSEKSGGGNKAKEDLTAYKLAYPNDIVLNSMNVIAGAVGLSKYFGAISPVYYTLYTNEDRNHISYFNNIFQTQAFQKSLMGLGNGIMIKESGSGKLNTIRLRISMEKLKGVMLPVPLLHEQEAIANYLDEKVEKIDQLIAEQNQSIDKWKEYKQSLITETVTKGLNPNVEMKDSGIEWIGKIPKTWEVIPNKYVMKKIKDICIRYDNEDILSLTMNGVIIRDLDNPTGKMPTTFDGYQRLSKGNLLMCLFDIDVTPRCIGLINNNGLTSPAYSQFTLKNGNIAKYYYYYYLNLDFTKELLHLSKNLRNSLTENLLGAVKVPRPPIHEQQAIANYLDKQVGKIDQTIEQKNVLIKQLEEYKQSLIYECVTGKRCVL